MKRLILLLTLLAAACGPVPSPQPPPPPPSFCVAPHVNDTVSGQPVGGASVWVNGAKGTTGADGYLYLYPVSAGAATIQVTAPGYQETDQPYTVSTLACDVNVLLKRTFPAVPSAATVTGSHLTFQGLTIGGRPWFDAALWSPQLDAERESDFAQKTAAGDTAAIILFYSGGKLYDEPNQPYSEFTVPDYEHNPTAFAQAVATTILHGFTPWVYLEGDGPGDHYKDAYRQFPLAYQALLNTPYGDLNKYVLYKPGWDSVFYGWPDDQHTIPGFASLVRSLCSYCYLGIEFNTGHIPLGNGPGDYAPGGLMRGYNVLDVEFQDGGIHTDSTWQVLGRLLGPAYHRPADQPANDDPRPPYYLDGTGIVVNCFEFYEYEWVRLLVTVVQIQTDRSYLVGLGCKVVG